jgi:hypothetical protein
MPKPFPFGPPPPPPQPAFEAGPLAAYAQLNDNPVIRRLAQEVIDWRAWHKAVTEPTDSQVKAYQASQGKTLKE